MYKYKPAFLVISLLLIISCSSTPSLEEKLIGNWSGELEQSNYGIIKVELEITGAELNQVAGEYRSEPIDLSNCQTPFAYCKEYSCERPIWFLRREGDRFIYRVEQNGFCDLGEAKVSLVEDNTLQYDLEFDRHPGIKVNGRLTRQ